MRELYETNYDDVKRDIETYTQKSLGFFIVRGFKRCD